MPGCLCLESFCHGSDNIFHRSMRMLADHIAYSEYCYSGHMRCRLVAEIAEAFFDEIEVSFMRCSLYRFVGFHRLTYDTTLKDLLVLRERLCATFRSAAFTAMWSLFKPCPVFAH